MVSTDLPVPSKLERIYLHVGGMSVLTVGGAVPALTSHLLAPDLLAQMLGTLSNGSVNLKKKLRRYHQAKAMQRRTD